MIINCKEKFIARRGARLCEERSEERNTNREGEALGSATATDDLF